MKQVATTVVAAAMTVAALEAAQENGNPEALSIGWAMRDVSVKGPIPIGGQFYLRISRQISDPITLTALVIGNRKEQVAFLSIDQTGAVNTLCNEICAGIKARVPEFPADNLIISATHTHSAPMYYDVFGMDDGVPDYPVKVDFIDPREYRKFLVASAVDALAEAWEKRTPGQVAWGYGFATVGHSRRVTYLDDVSQRPEAKNRPGLMVNGHAVMGGKTNDDMFAGYEAGTTSFADFLYTFDMKGKLTGAIVNVPAPSQCSQSEWGLSADYWHDFRTAVKKKYGDVFILAQCGAAGDLMPRYYHYLKAKERRFRLKYDMDKLARIVPIAPNTPPEKEQTAREWLALGRAERMDIAEEILKAFDNVLQYASKDKRSALPIKARALDLQLSRRMLPEAELPKEQAILESLMKEKFHDTGDVWDDLYFNSRLNSQRNRAKGVIARIEEEKKNPKFQAKVNIVTLGDIAFASNPTELYTDFAHRIQARSPFEQTFIVQLSRGVAGYLATERAVANRGYSATIYCNKISPQGGQELVDATVKALKELK